MGFFRGSQLIISKRTVNIGAMTSECGAHAERGKNYIILLLATLTSILTQELNAFLGGLIVDKNSLLHGPNLLSNARSTPWGG